MSKPRLCESMNDQEYPTCIICKAEWTILPAENQWDVETAYLQHHPECEYAKKRLKEYEDEP